MSFWLPMKTITDILMINICKAKWQENPPKYQYEWKYVSIKPTENDILKTVPILITNFSSFAVLY